jgi:hypothetical protein
MDDDRLPARVVGDDVAMLSDLTQDAQFWTGLSHVGTPTQTP